MDELRDLLIDKTLAIRGVVDDYEEGEIYPANYLIKVKTLAEEMIAILEKWEFMSKH